MIYGVLDEYAVSSTRRGVEQSLKEVSKAGEKLDSYKSELERKLREVKSAFSSLERAMDDRVRELQRNAGKSSGYSSYSPADSNIKSERRKIDGLIDKISDGCRELDNVRRSVKSVSGEVLPEFEKIQRSHQTLTKELERMTGVADAADKKFESTSRELEKLARKSRDDARKNSEDVADLQRRIEHEEREKREELATLQRENRDNERRLRSEIDSERRKSKLAKAAAIAALANSEDSDDTGTVNESHEARIAEVEANCERKIAELTEHYEQKLAEMKADFNREECESLIEELSDLLENKERELEKRNGEFEVSRNELEQKSAELAATRSKNQLLTVELSREKNSVENYKILLKKRTVMHLMALKVLGRIKRFVLRWYLWMGAVWILVWLGYMLWGVFADV